MHFQNSLLDQIIVKDLWVKFGGDQLTNTGFHIIVEYLVISIFEVKLVPARLSSTASKIVIEFSEKSNSGKDIIIPSRCGADSMSAVRAGDSSGIVDRRSTSKLDFGG